MLYGLSGLSQKVHDVFRTKEPANLTKTEKSPDLLDPNCSTTLSIRPPLDRSLIKHVSAEQPQATWTLKNATKAVLVICVTTGIFAFVKTMGFFPSGWFDGDDSSTPGRFDSSAVALSKPTNTSLASTQNNASIELACKTYLQIDINPQIDKEVPLVDFKPLEIVYNNDEVSVKTKASSLPSVVNYEFLYCSSNLILGAMGSLITKNPFVLGLASTYCFQGAVGVDVNTFPVECTSGRFNKTVLQYASYDHLSAQISEHYNNAQNQNLVYPVQESVKVFARLSSRLKRSGDSSTFNSLMSHLIEFIDVEGKTRPFSLEKLSAVDLKNNPYLYFYLSPYLLSSNCANPLFLTLGSNLIKDTLENQFSWKSTRLSRTAHYDFVVIDHLATESQTCEAAISEIGSQQMIQKDFDAYMKAHDLPIPLIQQWVEENKKVKLNPEDCEFEDSIVVERLRKVAFQVVKGNLPKFITRDENCMYAYWNNREDWRLTFFPRLNEGLLEAYKYQSDEHIGLFDQRLQESIAELPTSTLSLSQADPINELIMLPEFRNEPESSYYLLHPRNNLFDRSEAHEAAKKEGILKEKLTYIVIDNYTHIYITLHVSLKSDGGWFGEYKKLSTIQVPLAGEGSGCNKYDYWYGFSAQVTEKVGFHKKTKTRFVYDNPNRWYTLTKDDVITTNTDPVLLQQMEEAVKHKQKSSHQDELRNLNDDLTARTSPLAVKLSDALEDMDRTYKKLFGHLTFAFPLYLEDQEHPLAKLTSSQNLLLTVHDYLTSMSTNESLDLFLATAAKSNDDFKQKMQEFISTLPQNYDISQSHLLCSVYSNLEQASDLADIWREEASTLSRTNKAKRK
jgi:hypothetical protein